MSSHLEWTTIARILRPQGRKGEVLAELLTDFPERFADRKELHFKKPDGVTAPARLIAHWFPTGKTAGKVVLHFEGIDSITAAEGLARFEVVIPDSERALLEEGSFYVDDLVGCTIIDAENTIGVVQDVHFPTDTHGKRVENAVPILVVQRANGDELLIPLAKEFLHQPDIANKRIDMHLPDGLLDMND